MDEDDNSCEPMEIDLSANSINAMEISYGESAYEKSRTDYGKNYCTVIKPNESVDNSAVNHSCQNITKLVNIKNNNNRTLLIIAVIVSVVTIFTFNILAFKCYEDFNLATLNETLHNKLYGQTLAIKNVLEFLNFKEQAKVLALYGGTGVGKTYMVTLLFEDVFNHTNIYYYSMSNLERIFSSESMFGIALCKTSIVIIDDITLDNKELKNYVKELITRSTNLDKSITIILIYNCAYINQQFHSSCPDSYLSDLKILLNNDINTMKKFVKFESLTEDSLKKCIQYELRDSIPTESDIIKIMKNFNVQKDGCKGVHQKTKYLNII